MFKLINIIKSTPKFVNTNLFEVPFEGEHLESYMLTGTAFNGLIIWTNGQKESIKMNKQDYHRLKVEFDDIKDVLLALGDEKRQLIIIALLHQESCEGLRVTDLTDITELSRPAVSHHLKILKQAGIVDIRSEGTKNYYYLSNMAKEVSQLKELIEHVLVLLEEKER